MTPEEVGARLASLLAAADTDADAHTVAEETTDTRAEETAGTDTGAEVTVGADAGAEVTVGRSGGQAYARATVDVPLGSWRAALRTARDDAELACDFFDWLSAVDELAAGFDVVAHLWSTRHRHGVLLRTRVPRQEPTVPSVVDLYPGAGWHERETYEMFGITFDGHPDLAPLLLPPEFEGHPLRKEFVLASRVAKAWPGAKEPGESEAGTGRRQAMRPPGVPAPGEWGPAAAVPGAESPPGRPARRRPTTGTPGSPARPAVSGPPGSGPQAPAAPGATADAEES